MKKLNIIALALLGFMSCKQAAEVKVDTKFTISDTLKKMIKIDSAREENIADELLLSGEVTYNQDKVVKVFPLGSGMIIDVKVGLGDFVKKGDVLAIMKSAEVAGAASDLAAANADVQVAQKKLATQESLYKSGIISEKDYLESKEDLVKANANLEKLQEVSGIYGVSKGGNYAIKAPITGYIVGKNIANGMNVRTDDAESMFTISDLQEVWIIANVFETDITRVKEGESATIKTIAYPDRPFTGTIERVSEILDPENKVMKVRIRLNNADHALKPEMFANVTLHSPGSSKAVSLPNDAIIFDNGQYFVIQYISDTDVKVVPVSVIKQVENRTYINSAIKPGDLVITKSALMIYRSLTDL